MVEYYDFVLGLIPLAFASTFGTALVGGASRPVAIGVGGAAVVPLVLHALFVRTPGRRTRDGDRTTAPPVNAD